MKTILIGTTGSLNKHWQELQGSQNAVWFLRDPVSRSHFEPQAPSHIFTDWVTWAFEILELAGENPPQVLRQDQQFALLRIALRDFRSQSLGDLLQALELPGMARRLLQRVKSRTLRSLVPDDTPVWFRDESVDALTFIIQDLQQQSGTIDETGLLIRFISELGKENISKAITSWYDSLCQSGKVPPVIVIPRADRLNEIQRIIVLNLFDLVPDIEIGIAASPDDSPESLAHQMDIWSGLKQSVETRIIALDKTLPEIISFSNSGDSTANVHCVKLARATVQNQWLHEVLRTKHADNTTLEGVELFTTADSQQIDDLIESCQNEGIGLIGLQRPLIESPEVRTILDIAVGIRDDWPVESLVDLLRHPNFRDSVCGTDLTRMHMQRLATDVARLGNLNGIKTIRDMLACKWAEERTGNSELNKPAYHTSATQFFTQLNELVTLPEDKRPWQMHMQWWQQVLDSLLDFSSSVPVSDYFEVLGSFGELELTLAEGVWDWSDFLTECHLQAEQHQQDVTFQTSRKLRIHLNRIPEISFASYLYCLGMKEGSFPSKSLLAQGLHRSVPLDELYQREQQHFRELCGLASESLTFSYPVLDHKGVESESAGFLRKMPWQEFHFVPGSEQAKARLLKSSAQRFFTRAVTQFSQRNVGDVRSLGKIDSEQAQEQLATLFGPDYGFSPTALEVASLCHFQFFARHVLHLVEDEVDEDLTTDYRAEGSVIHEVLEELHTVFDNYHEIDLDAFREQVNLQIIKHHTPTKEIEDSPLGRGRWSVERRRIEHRLASYVDQLTDFLKSDRTGDGLQTRALGLEVQSRGANARIEPLRIVDPQSGAQVLVHGRIDRIDAAIDGQKAIVRLIDYKTGSKIPPTKITRKLHLQLPLYALMLDGSKMKGYRLQVADVGFWYLKKSLKGFNSITKQVFDKDVSFDIEKIRNEYSPFVLNLVREIRRGNFEIRPRESLCDKQCPMSEVCRIAEIRDHSGMRAR